MTDKTKETKEALEYYIRVCKYIIIKNKNKNKSYEELYAFKKLKGLFMKAIKSEKLTEEKVWEWISIYCDQQNLLKNTREFIELGKKLGHVTK